MSGYLVYCYIGNWIPPGEGSLNLQAWGVDPDCLFNISAVIHGTQPPLPGGRVTPIPRQVMARKLLNNVRIHWYIKLKTFETFPGDCPASELDLRRRWAWKQ